MTDPDVGATRGGDGDGGSSDYAVLGRIADEVQAAIDQGERVDLDRLTRSHPELAGEVRQVVSALIHLGELRGAPESAESGPPSPAPPSSRRLGDYEIVREVGRGGMGVVYEALQVSLDRRVALKVLPFAGVLDERHLRRFRNEAHAAAQLHHPHIVPVYAVGTDRGVHFYAMQFIDGRSLAEVIAEERAVQRSGEQGVVDAAPRRESRSTTAGPPTSRSSRRHFEGVARLGLQIARALEYAHSVGVVHRDIKPSNLLLDASGDVWITDFGLARAPGDSSLTLSGDILGTLRYMSPEQAEGHQDRVDGRSDLYSFGATLYELMTLVPAIPSEGKAEIFRHVLHVEPVPPRQRRRDVPRDLETIVLKTLSKAPRERYATAGALAADLERFLEGRPVEARRPGPLKRIGKWVARNRRLAASLSVVLVAVAVSGVLAVRLDREARTRQYDLWVEEAADAVEQAFVDRWRLHRGAGSNTRAFVEPEAGRSRGVLEGAGARLKDARDLQPGRPEAPYQLARCLELLGRPEEARDTLKRLLDDADFAPARSLWSVLATDDSENASRAVPDDDVRETPWIRAWTDLESALRGRRWPDAVDAYERLIELERTQESLVGFAFGLRFGLGVAYLESGKPREAQFVFYTARDRRPESRAALLLFVETCLMLDEADRAERAILGFVQNAPDPDSVVVKVAQLYSLFRPEEAFDWADRVADVRRRDRLRVALLFQQYRFLEAAQEGIAALERSPGDALLHVLVARAFGYAPGREADSDRYLSRGLELAREDDAEVWYHAAYVRAYTHEDAARFFNRCLAADPEYPLARSWLAFALVSGHRIDEGLDEANEVLRRFPDNLTAHYAIGIASHFQGRYEEAVARLKRAIELYPRGYNGARVYLAAVYCMVNEVDEAEKVYERALEVEENDLPSRRRYAHLLSRRGRVEEAIFHWCRSLPLDPSFTYDKIWWAFNDAIRSPPAAEALRPLDAARKEFCDLAAGSDQSRIIEGAALVCLRAPSGKDLGEALRLAHRAVELARNADSLATLAAVKAELGEVDEALALLDEALETPGARDVHLAQWERLRERSPGRVPTTPTTVDLELERIFSEREDAADQLEKLVERIGGLSRGLEPRALAAYAEARGALRLELPGKAAAAALRGLSVADRLAAPLLSCWWKAQVAESNGAALEDVLPATSEGLHARRVREDWTRLLKKLAAGQTLRIDCGGDEDHGDSTESRAWWRDSFFLGGYVERQRGPTEVRGAGGRRVYETARTFHEGALGSGYRVPLPPGRYRVRLHLAQFFKPYGAWIRFDATLEETTIRGLAPGRTGPAIELRELELEVRDGFLDLSLVPQRAGQPWDASIAAFEIEPLLVGTQRR